MLMWQRRYLEANGGWIYISPLANFAGTILTENRVLQKAASLWP